MMPPLESHYKSLYFHNTGTNSVAMSVRERKKKERYPDTKKCTPFKSVQIVAKQI